MIHRLRRVRVPPSLAGHGPGRPASSAALDLDVTSTAPLTSTSALRGPADSSLSSHPSDAPPRQKMPLGSDRDCREEPAGVAGPSSELSPRASALAAALSPLPRRHEKPQIPHREYVPPTIVHAALARPNPPSPRQLLDYMRGKPQLYTLESVSALAQYAARTNDVRVQRAAADLLRTERMPTISNAVERPQPLVDMNAELKAIAGVTPNTMLVKLYPPLRELESRAVKPLSLIGRLHFMYLAGEPISLPTALDMLRAARGTDSHELGLLHLHLAYTPHPSLPILRTFKRLSSAPLSRQTLHLCILSLLRHHRENGTTNVVDDIGDTLLFFSNPDRTLNRTPGPETWRHIAQFALETDNEYLAHLAFLGAKTALSQDRQRRDNFQTPADGVAPKFLHLGRNLTRWERLLHLLAKRGWVVRKDTAPESYAPRLIAKWEWCGRKGEAAAGAAAEAAARRAESVVEEQVEEETSLPDDTPRYTPNIDVLLKHAKIDSVVERSSERSKKKNKRKEKVH